MIVHVDGRVEYQDANVPEPEPEPEAAAEPTQMKEAGAETFHFGSGLREIEDGAVSPAVPIPTFEEEDFADEPSEEMQRDFSPEEEAPPPEPEAPPAEEVSLAPDVDVFADAESDIPAEPPSPAYKVAASPDSPDLKDIAGFGNSGLAGARDGALRYTVFVEGIDTADVRNAFREAITDRKFMWDTDQILRSLRHGEVKITNVSAGKAYILISRLRTLPVKVRWEQYAVHQT